MLFGLGPEDFTRVGAWITFLDAMSRYACDKEDREKASELLKEAEDELHTQLGVV